MKVVICGAGQVGFHIARYLAGENNDVTVVDQSPELIGKINDQLDVQAFVGHASHPDVLERAGAGDADMLIAVTFTDEVNMIACQVAHSLFNVPTKIARIRQQNYLDPTWANLFARDQLPIDVIISPEIEVARAIARRIRVPGAFDMIPMAEDRVRVIGVRCTEDCPVIHTPLRQLTSLFPDLNITVTAILRDETMQIPSADDQMLPGDEVYFVAETGHVARAMAVFGHEEKETRRLIIVGGGNIGTTLADDIANSEDGYTAKIIELDKRRARKVAEILPTTTIIQGNALDHEILEEAGIRNADAIVAVTDHDESNVLCSLLSKRYGVERAVTLINKTNYGPLITALGVDVVVSPREITASTILQHVRRGRIRSVHSLRDGYAEIIEAEALETSSLVGQPLKDARLPNGVIVGAVVRGDKVIIPRPDTAVEAKDRVILLADAKTVKKVEKMFAVRLEYF
ncbi:Trk system potassium transporter TrkA [Marivibrio halodurans]|uniref:Trk system potassium uptake protein TrkA n=1 Tax=Marivibrio halodurans TaxID=2039722 RepID=A0A8J7S4P3_9PROT|nr:Trk system potassium transporter TrkA [Marivibrio halodurans]MBP5855577.1 Trk system potassium transporter TrkA [Marivibrio halodurans]